VFLDKAPDVLRFASLGTTEQGDSCTEFKIDYLKPSGAIGFYHPDWVAVQETPDGEVNWILETKGRAWEDTAAKEAAMHEWCARVSEQTGQVWRHARVNQVEFDMLKPKTLEAAATPGMRPPTSSRTLL
jgi:type III restriction enzyme